MSFANRCSSDFPSQIRSRGEQYFRERRVQLDEIHDDRVEASVSGDSGQYDVTLDWSCAGEGFVDATCTCPYYRDSGLCKHIWATILTAEAEGAGPKAGHRKLTVVEAGYDDDDYLDDEDDDYDQRYLPSSRRAPSSRAPTGWKRQLEAAFEHDDGPDDDHEVFFSPRSQKTREAWFVLDVAACLETNAVVVRLFQREARQTGEFGKLKSLSIDQRGIDRFQNVEDRELLRLLLANKEDSDEGYDSYRNRYGYNYYGYEPKTSEVSLAAEAYDKVLPGLCATGRFLWLLNSSRQDPQADGRSLAWDDGAPWRFRLRIEPDDESQRWQLEGQLVRGADEPAVALKSPPLVLATGLVLQEDRLARLDANGSAGWLRALRQYPSITVPYRDRWELLKRLWQLPSRVDTLLPANLACEELTLPPQARLIVRPPERYNPNRLDGDVEFHYDDQSIRPADRSAGIVDAKRQRILVRDRPKERELLAFLAAQGARAADRTYGDEHDVSIPREPLSALVAALVQAGWLVEAEGGRIRKPGQWKLSVTSGVDWFDLEGTCDFDGATAKLPDLLAALRHGEQFVRLDDGTRGLLPQEWLDKFASLLNMGEAQDGHVRFRPSQAMLLDALLAAQKEVSVDKQFAHVRQKLRSFSGISRRDEPRGFQGQLRDYQKDGLGWLHFLRDFRFGGCLADDMGLGKTVQVLALLQARRLRPKENGRRTPSLAVVPRSLVFNWIEESQKFAPGLRVLDYTGPLRRDALKSLDQYDLVVTTYGTLHRDITKFKDLRFDYAILDEAQAIKNAQSQRAKTCRLLQADHRLAMTGTPVENHLGELWSLFEFLNPGMLGSSSAFQGVSKKITEQTENLDVLRRALAPFILRRTKGQVLTELPEKTEQTLHCDLEGQQKKRYNELRDYYRLTLKNRIRQTGLAKAKIHVLEALLRLRQAALHPGLIDKQHQDRSSAKLDVLMDQLAEVTQEGHKALVFSQFTSFLAIVRRRLDREKVVYEYLDGQTRNRKQSVDRFQNDPQCTLFLISMKAGGHGLNLTAADYVFILDPWWNPAVEAQAVDRVHRIGQSRNVFAYRLIARDTVEEKILELQKTKRELADAIISADSNVLRSLTAEDLEMLLS